MEGAVAARSASKGAGCRGLACIAAGSLDCKPALKGVCAIVLVMPTRCLRTHRCAEFQEEMEGLEAETEVVTRMLVARTLEVAELKAEQVRDCAECMWVYAM